MAIKAQPRLLKILLLSRNIDHAIYWTTADFTPSQLSERDYVALKIGPMMLALRQYGRRHYLLYYAALQPTLQLIEVPVLQLNQPQSTGC